MFGGAALVTRTAVYVLRNYFLLLVAGIIGCTSLGSFLWKRLFYENNMGLNEHVLTLIVIVLRLGLLALCTASMIGSTYTSFLYFKFWYNLHSKAEFLESGQNEQFWNTKSWEQGIKKKTKQNTAWTEAEKTPGVHHRPYLSALYSYLHGSQCTDSG